MLIADPGNESTMNVAVENRTNNRRIIENGNLKAVFTLELASSSNIQEFQNLIISPLINSGETRLFRGWYSEAIKEHIPFIKRIFPFKKN